MNIIIIIITVIILIYTTFYLVPTFYLKLKTKISRTVSGKTLYLTFDDGPSKYTEELLNLLDKYEIKATFFCVANFIPDHIDIISKMIRQGHVIALHSFKHENGLLMTPHKIRTDFDKSLNITKLYDLNIHFFRPPWGHLSYFVLKYIKKYNMKLVLWHIMAEDWKANTSKEQIANKLLTRIKGNDIICLHDGRGKNEAPKKTIDALEEVIPILLERGYKFETLNSKN